MMGLLYEPREADEMVFIGRELLGPLEDDPAFCIVDADGIFLNQYAVRITPNGLRRYGGGLVARLDCAHDADGRIALHPDDPAVRRIRELEAEVDRLRSTPPTLADQIVGSVNDRVAEVKAERDKALARVAELEAAVKQLINDSHNGFNTITRLEADLSDAETRIKELKARVAEM